METKKSTKKEKLNTFRATIIDCGQNSMLVTQEETDEEYKMLSM